ncbi:MAG: hypothetical protein QXH61_01495 [Candidatus Nezhaarchaeales archaeon]
MTPQKTPILYYFPSFPLNIQVEERKWLMVKGKVFEKRILTPSLYVSS